MEEIYRKIYKMVGANIRRERKTKHITQEELAEKCGLCTSFVGQVERGHNQASLVTLVKVARSLEIPLALLFSEEGTTPQKKVYKPATRLDYLLRDKSKDEQEVMLDIVKAVSRKIRKIKK